MFVIDNRSGTPPFEQLRGQVIERIADGSLTPGARLPTVRALAAEVGVAANTVARAYRELEADGVIETRGRNGTVVSAHGNPAERQVQLAAREFAEKANRLGVEPGAAIAMVAAALRH